MFCHVISFGGDADADETLRRWCLDGRSQIIGGIALGNKAALPAPFLACFCGSILIKT